MIDLLQRSLAITALSLEEEFHDPWRRELARWEIPGSEVRKALLHMEGLEKQLDLIRRKLEMIIEETIDPLPF